MEEKLEVLKGMKIFQGADNEVLGKVAGITEERTFERNDTIIKMKEPGSSMYIIKSGGVNVYHEGGKAGEFMLRHLKAGEIIGEMALFDDEPRSALVKATGPTTVFEIQKDKFFNLLEEGLSKDAVLKLLLFIIKKLSQRLRFTSSDLYISMGVGKLLTQEEIDELKDELKIE